MSSYVLSNFPDPRKSGWYLVLDDAVLGNTLFTIVYLHIEGDEYSENRPVCYLYEQQYEGVLKSDGPQRWDAVYDGEEWVCHNDPYFEFKPVKWRLVEWDESDTPELPVVLQGGR